MANYLITGYWGEPHITAENDRGINAAIFGAGRFVLPVGERFKAEYLGNNIVRLYDGKLLDNGAAAGIPVGEYIDLLIPFAKSGMKRNDLIVFQYAQDISSLVETGYFMVLQGEETVETPVDPEVVQSNLLSGKSTLDQMPLWRVSVTDKAIDAPVQLFSMAKSILEVEEIAKNGSGGDPEGGSGTGSDEVLPIEKGGTGARTAEDALANLGAAPAKHEHSAESITGLADAIADWPKIEAGSYAGNGESSKRLEFDFKPKLVIVTSDDANNPFTLILISGVKYAPADGTTVTVTWGSDYVSWKGGIAEHAANGKYFDYSYIAFG